MNEKHRPNYILIWAWLGGLVIASIAASLLLPRGAAILVMFGAAAIKALLVAINYMNLRYEKAALYALVALPIIIVLILTLALFPDFVLSH